MLEWTVKKRTKSTPEKRVDELAGVQPSKVEIVEGGVVVENVQKSGQFRNAAGELVDMYVTKIGRLLEIVLVVWSQHNRYDVVLQCIQIELLGYIIFAVRVLKGRTRRVCVSLFVCLVEMQNYRRRALYTMYKVA